MTNDGRPIPGLRFPYGRQPDPRLRERFVRAVDAAAELERRLRAEAAAERIEQLGRRRIDAVSAVSAEAIALLERAMRS